MNMNNKLVSIIIPTFRSKGGIISSVDSVLDQTYQNLEVIVIDDNDPDTNERLQTESFMSKYQSDSRVRYIKHDRNRNGAVARNTGIKASNGEYIAFLDDDDTFRKDKIERQVMYLESHPDMDAVYTSIAIDGRPIVLTPYEGNALLPLLTERTRMFTSTLLFKRKPILEIRGFTESFRRHQDFDLLIKFFYAGYHIGCIKEVLADYNNISTNRLKGRSLEDLKAQYLLQFSAVIDSLEDIKKGSRNKIIANNYASVFVSYVAMHEYRLAYSLVCKYFLVSPVDFISYVLFFLKCQFLKRVQNN